MASLANDYATAPISQSDRAMLDYVRKLTLTPGQVGRNDIETLRGAGFSDAAILDTCQVTAYFAFANRLADGLGVEVESDGS